MYARLARLRRLSALVRLLAAGSLAVVVLILDSGAAPALAAEPQRPNIVLMMADDLGWGDTGYNGHPVLQTPHLDRLAAGGLRCDRFYAAAPVCSPTRGSCLTGRHPFRYGIYFANTGYMRAEELTLAELLGRLGYRTGHFGKWHLGTLTTQTKDSNRGGPQNVREFAPPWKNGFATCFSTEAKVPTWDPMLRPRSAKGNTWWNPAADRAQAEAYGTRYWNNSGEVVTDNLQGDDSRVIMDRAIPFVQDAVDQQAPFFAVIWFHAPHLPVVAGPKYTARYKDQSPYAQHYFGCITALDEQVGRLQAELQRLGVAENTLVAFCSDNGPEGRAGKAPGSAKNLRGRKRSLFEGGIRVPGIIHWPARVAAGSTTEIPLSTNDYLPTILAAVGAELGDDRPLDGINLLPVLSGEQTARGAGLGFQSQQQAAWVEDRYKLVRPSRKGDYLLFDLTKDAGEQHNLAADQADRVARMAKQLSAWQESCTESDRGRDY